ncbi:MAG: hypothetical protein JXR68_12975 [Bacteroidales bacterium]|nr:hypothetical protein [Bacteroidales bacterium]
MATISEVCMVKFIADLKKGVVKDSLKELNNKIKLEVAYTGKFYSSLLNLNDFRRIFTPKDLAKIITAYRTINAKQLTLL